MSWGNFHRKNYRHWCQAVLLRRLKSPLQVSILAALNQNTTKPQYHNTKEIGGANLFARVLDIFCATAIKIAAPGVLQPQCTTKD